MVKSKTNGVNGYRRSIIYLNHFCDAKGNHKYVCHLMKLLKLKAVIRRKRYNYKPHRPNLIVENTFNRQFQKEYKPIEVLLDVKEFKYNHSSKAYLSAVLDYGTNKIIDFKLSLPLIMLWYWIPLSRLEKLSSPLRPSP